MKKQKESKLKGFFKLTKLKIFIFLVLLVITIITVILHIFLACDFDGCDYSNFSYFVYKFLFIMDNGLLKDFLKLPGIVLIIFEALYLYILSCLIFFAILWLKENVRKK